jgi:hypothetical protein
MLRTLTPPILSESDVVLRKSNLHVTPEEYDSDRVHVRARQYRLNHKASTPRRDPTTERHGDFWLLGYPPGPVRPSLADLDTPNSSRVSISMPILVWTSSQRGPLCNRTPNLKPSTEPDLQEAGLQECATPTLRRDPPATGDGRYGPGTLYGLWPRSRWTWTRRTPGSQGLESTLSLPTNESKEREGSGPCLNA